MLLTNWVHIILVVLLFGGILGGVQLVKLRREIPTWVTRKLAHVGSALVVLFMPYYFTGHQIAILAIAFGLGLGLSKKVNLLSAIHGIKRASYGEVTFPIGLGITALICLPQNHQAFQAAVLVVGLSDALAEIAGHFWPLKKITLFNQKKSIGGSVCFLISVFLIYFGFFPSTTISGLALIFAFAVVLTVVEVTHVYGFDNLTLPIVAGWGWVFIEGLT
jgi:dolichol kinase